uniref:Chromosome transmission fidelity factor 8 n=1 Tax=Mandrillus leucophaeus TaxID=9568 RepID=A0A2K5ZFY4_MANLE
MVQIVISREPLC